MENNARYTIPSFLRIKDGTKTKVEYTVQDTGYSGGISFFDRKSFDDYNQALVFAKAHHHEQDDAELTRLKITKTVRTFVGGHVVSEVIDIAYQYITKIVDINKQDSDNITTKSANGVTGHFLYSASGNYMFRVYGDDGEFIDYDVLHSDLVVTINDSDAFLYSNNVLDHSPNTLGKNTKVVN